MRCRPAIVRPLRTLAAIVASAALASAGRAQIAHFAGVQTVVASSGLTSPIQVAVDSAENVYVLDAGSSQVLKETLVAGGYQQTVVTATAMKSPSALAVDTSGNIFVVDSGNNRILRERPSGSTYTESVMPFTGLNAPSGIAVDSSGNIYISDTGNNRIIEEALIGTNYSQSTLVSPITTGSIAVDQYGYLYVQLLDSGQIEKIGWPVTLGGGLSASSSVAIDPSGVVYINDGGNAHLFRELANSNISYLEKNILSAAGAQWSGMAVDGNRNVYYCDLKNRQVFKLSLRGGDFGTVAVGAASSPMSLIFGFDAGQQISSIVAVTQGIKGLDYSDAGTGTCTTNGPSHIYYDGDSCTVDVIFTPKGPGGRYGAAILYDSSGNPAATGYVKGNGASPQVHFPATITKYSPPGLTSPTSIAADAAGNLYIVNAVLAFDPGNAVYKETPSGNGYIESIVATNLAYPLEVTVDGAGNVYVLDEGTYAIFKYSPNSSGGYTQTTFDTAISGGNSLGVDGFGNIYFGSGADLHIDTPADGYYGSRFLNVNTRPGNIAVDYQDDIYYSTGKLFRETPSNGNYVMSTVPNVDAGLLAVDGVGNIYVGYENVFELSPTGNSYSMTVLSPSYSASGLAVDGMANVYYTGASQNSVWKIDFSHPPSLHFAATAVGETSTDSPRTLTIQNSGNAPLSFPIPQTGNNPSLPSGFTAGNSSTCPDLGPAAAEPGSLGAGAKCNYYISFSPESATDTSGWAVVTDDSLNAAAPAYASQSAALAVAGAPLAPTIIWPTPADIIYGTALNTLQLNATTNVAGTFSYSPAMGAVLGVGSHTLTATFTPNDTVAFQSISVTVTLVVTQATPQITWPNPAPITYGTALSSTQLNASTPVAGSFSYSPASAAILHAGSQTLSVTFTPSDSVDYKKTTVTVTLVVNQAVPVLTWATPAAITYGTPLSSQQLDATSTAPGTFAYSPAAGAVLSAGPNPLNVTFTATDSLDYKQVADTVSLQVNQAKPAIAWTTPAAITYGTPLGSAQLDATSKIPGRFYYNPGLGTILTAGSHTLQATIFPDDNLDYSSNSVTVTLTVYKATPAVTWATPAPITYGTALTSTQLDATSTNPGTFAYSPAAGTVLGLGTHTLKATFTPTDTGDYTVPVSSTTLVVNKATPAITWPTPSAIPYGTALTSVQLDASSKVAGSFAYSPASGTILDIGTHTLKATFTPTDSADYLATIASVTLTVGKAIPAIAWPTPAAIAYGTPLSSAQLNATVTGVTGKPLGGTLAYTPSAGTILNAGSQKLSLTFTPTDSTDYAATTATVTLTVNKATPAVTWSTPAAISYGAALTSTQLDATSNVAGTFAYSPAAGTVLGIGTHTLKATFTPTDTADYAVVIPSVTLTVNQATPTITWPAPAPIASGTPLSSTQLNATVTGVTGKPLPGTLTYNPPAGTVLSAGQQTLTVSFTPTDTTDYKPASASVTITVQ